MITTLPSVQYSCLRAKKYFRYKAKSKLWDKRYANRRYRRALNDITHSFILDPESFDSETFNVPSLSSWDIY